MTSTSVTPRLDANVKALQAVTGIDHNTVFGFSIPALGMVSHPGQNIKTLTILAFAKYAGLTILQTLPLFGEAYEEVLAQPGGDNHKNIRALMQLNSERYGLEEVVIDRVDGGTYLRNRLNELWEDRANVSATSDNSVLEPINDAIDLLNSGQCRVAFKLDGYGWYTDEAMKKAVLLSFRVNNNVPMGDGALQFYDKVPTKYADMSAEALKATGVRVVPPAVARRGSYQAKNVILMPSYVNIGAYVDEGTMVDTWATVGSCAQIGKNVHLSGGVGIGGVLEPLQARPTIIEDNCFIGARSEVVEGVIVEENSVLSMGVYLSQSTKIYDRATGEITYGRIPAGSVVIPGSLPSADGKYSMYCAVIVKRVDAQTRAKTSLNDLLRD